MSLYGIIFRGGPAIGALIMGVASDRVGLRLPLAAGALLAVFAWLWTWTARGKIMEALEATEPAD
jgi:predicted MFS family arabinose efflux permease